MEKNCQIPLRATCLDRPDYARERGHEDDQDPDEPGGEEVLATLEDVLQAVEGGCCTVLYSCLTHGGLYYFSVFKNDSYPNDSYPND